MISEFVTQIDSEKIFFFYGRLDRGGVLLYLDFFNLKDGRI